MMCTYAVTEVGTGRRVLTFRAKTNVIARARAQRECKVLLKGSAVYELFRHEGPTHWKCLGALPRPEEEGKIYG